MMNRVGKLNGVVLTVSALLLLAHCSLVVAGEWAAETITGTNMVRQTSPKGTNYMMGKLGVGTNNPSSTLHVVGDMTVTGPMKIAKQGDISMGGYTQGESAGGVGGASGFSRLFYVTKNSDQDIGSQLWTKVTWSNEIYDVDGGFDPATGRYTPTTPGYYQFAVALYLGSTTSQQEYERIGLYVNTQLVHKVACIVNYTGSGIMQSSANCVFPPIYLNTTNYVEIKTWMSQALTLSGNRTNTWFSGVYCGN